MKRYLLTEPAFIASVLLAAGSIVTEDDLGTVRVPVKDKDGKPTGETEEIPVAGPSSAIEIDMRGNPVDQNRLDELASIVGAVATMPIAPIMPHADNPTRAQGAPAQPAGGVMLAERALHTAPAQGVESDAAAEAREEQADNETKEIAKLAGGAPRTTAPKRRGGGAPAPRRAPKPSPAPAPKPTEKAPE